MMIAGRMQGVAGAALSNTWGIDRSQMLAWRNGAYGLEERVLVNKYGAALFALLSFFVKGPSAISTASAIISHSSFGHVFAFSETPSFRTRSGTAVIDKGD